ncbi:MAG: hypothetical protein NXI31_20395 [bacterium]|nr:hypothetical protein [bacterium]
MTFFGNKTRSHGLLCAGVALTTLTATAQDWRLGTAPSSPSAATFVRLTYDLQRRVTVAFGGWDAPIGSTVFQDTWEYDGTNWVQRQPVTIPDERDSHGMVYDLARGRTIMFGGWDFNFALLGETWEWDGTNWVDRMPTNSPSARLFPAMAYDTTRGLVVLFGGEDAGGLRDDTWEYDGNDWRQATPATAPSPRAGHVVAFDSARSRTVLFGGTDNNQPLGDTWEFDGTNWSAITTDGAPAARVDAQMVFDDGRRRCVLFGGADAAIDRDDTWEFDGRYWRELITQNRPQGNSAMGMAYDTVRARTVVFGGFDGTAAIGDTWELGGDDATYRLFGTGCDGSNNLPPRIAPNALPAVGTTADLDIVDLPAGGGTAIVTIGLFDTVWNGQTLPLDLGPFGLSGCRAYASADASAVYSHANGTVNWALVIPNDPGLRGVRLFLQALSLDPAVTSRPFPGATSAAIEINIG